MTFDLSKLDTQAPAEEGSIVELENPFTGEPLVDEAGKPLTWTLRGDDAPQVRAVSRKQQNRRNDRIQKGRSPDLDAETLEAQRVDRILAATISYSDNFALDGKALPFSPENARVILTDSRFSWLPEQLNAALVDRKRFLSMASKR